MKRTFISVGAVVLIIIIAIFFRQQFFVPITDLTEEQIIKEIEANYEDSDLTEVQEIIFIDERNVFVPVIFDEVNYGMTTWEWTSAKKWELQSLDSNGGPKLWNNGDETERYFIWNMPPDEQVAGINFYMIRDRNAWISDAIPVYLPRIQLEQEVSFERKRYGMLKMPKEWVELSEKLSEDEAGRKSQLSQSMFSQDGLVQYGYRTVDNKGQLRYIETNGMQGGYGFSNGSDFNQLILELHEGEVESGK